MIVTHHIKKRTYNYSMTKQEKTGVSASQTTVWIMGNSHQKTHIQMVLETESLENYREGVAIDISFGRGHHNMSFRKVEKQWLR